VVRLVSTFAFATAPFTSFDGWGEDRCLIWETARPYFYARATEDGRAVVGGADFPFATAHKRDRSIERQTAKLEKAGGQAVRRSGGMSGAARVSS
jgi:hypothetical protein